MSDFTPIIDAAGSFQKTELDTGVDFTDPVDVGGVFAATELDESVDFVPTGDAGVIVAEGGGFGEGGFGEGPFGGLTSYTLTFPQTSWRFVDTP